MKKMTSKIFSKLFNDYGSFDLHNFPKYEFHIAKEIRKKYELDDEFFSIEGNIVFADYRAARLFVQKINSKRAVRDHVSTGKVNAAALIDEIYHFIFRQYEIHINPGVFNKAAEHLYDKLGEDKAKKILLDFVELFPPLDVYKKRVTVNDYLNSSTADRQNILITLEELILLYLANINPANKSIIELFDENYFPDKILYKKIISELELFFSEEKKIGPDNHDLLTFFKSPFLVNPDDIEAQLDFIREKWGVLLDDKFLKKLLGSKDLLKEDIRLAGFGGGDAPVFAPQYKGQMSEADFLSLGKSGYKYAEDSTKDYEEPENFTQDIDWMPKVVVMAKNVYVWLDQLSKKYKRQIRTLDQVPEEELDELSSWGFNGLWLIGIWERSNASKRIKHIMGNVDAVASAYSLYDYTIAHDLGGEEAYQNLNKRARRKGIRLASDMVPNHTGIFSKWVIENPHYFIQSNYPPFPSYRFSGPDLSDDPSVQIRIEDGYWSRSDAAVVFQRIDNRNGETRYIYHGNDGTNMPWNDTAQLNMLKRDVREAVIQKILEVARKFSIIRFDAAMTLTKRHFSRLWYPEPGSGGDIPSRADYAMTKDEFDSLFPEEFWREVVDRINTEMPDTLLLAEAFWLLEGYFVRSLGMHRVYNSAFMHMMMKEENEKYRDLITNTLEFEPEILKRYVNFMSNPDEETAIKQFGTDDKYFGVCTLMVTLPGLPMFAHGQIEGYTEKYGMEYQRAYYHETPSEWLVDRHRREIFPLMKKRYLFSQVHNFWFYDFVDNYGKVNENVFVYSNTEGDERAFVIYNNNYDTAAGRVFRSTPKLVSMSHDKKEFHTKTVAEALNINKEHKYYYIVKEHTTGLEYIKSGYEIGIEGIYVELGGFKYLVYLDIREMYDEFGDIEKLARRLSGKGVPSVARALVEMRLEPVHVSFENIFNDDSINSFFKSCILDGKEEDRIISRDVFVKGKYYNLLNTVNNHLELSKELEPILNDFEKEICAVCLLNKTLNSKPAADEKFSYKELHRIIMTNPDANYHDNSIQFLMWLIISNISFLFDDAGSINKNNYLNKILLDTPITKILQRLGKGQYELIRAGALLRILQEIDSGIINLFTTIDKESKSLTEVPNEIQQKKNEIILRLLESEDVKLFVGLNTYENVTYYSKENFEELLNWLYTLSLLEKIKLMIKINPTDQEELIADVSKLVTSSYNTYLKIKRYSDEAGYILEIFRESLFEEYGL